MGSITADNIIRLALDLYNSYQGLSIQDIQDGYEVSRRTAFRMKEEVERLFPFMEEVEQYNSRAKKWRLNKNPLGNMISFTSEEIAELEKCKSYIRNSGYTSHGELISEVIAKINVLNAKKASKTDVEALLEVEGFAARPHPRCKFNMDIFNTITDALKSYKCIDMDYDFGKGKITNISVQPYGIIYGEKTYLLAYSEYSEGYRYYLLHKIKSAKVTDYFDRDEDFDIQKYLSNAFGLYQENPMSVELLFSENVKDEILDYNIHPTQRIKQNKDGTTTVTFKAGGSHEICWYLFKWGENVKIISPESLKKTYKDLLNKAMSGF